MGHTKKILKENKTFVSNLILHSHILDHDDDPVHAQVGLAVDDLEDLLHVLSFN
jgi:hypothetical protein